LSEIRRMSTSSLINDSERRPSYSRKASIPLATENTRERQLTSRQQALALRAYGALLTLGAVALASILLLRGYHLGPLVATAVTAAVAVLCERLSVRLSFHLEASLSFLPGIFAAVLLGPLSAMVIAFVCLLGELGRPWERWIIWTGSRCVIFGIAGFAAVATNSATTLSGLFISTLVASVIVVIGDSVVGAITLSIRERWAPRAYLSELAKVSFAGMLVYVPVIAGLAYAYEHVSPWSAVIFIGPAFAAQRYFVLYREQTRATTELESAVAKLSRVNLSFATALVTALDARDHYTAGHSAAVAIYARDIAIQAGLSQSERDKAHLCGLLHDIGKIGVPVGVLEKSGSLTTGEWSAVQSHAEVGASILDRIEGYEEIATAVRHHHERFDGEGYPGGIAGEAIPLLSRIVAVADAYSAMTSERPYRIALSGEEARDRLERESGKQFDPGAVRALVAVLDGASEAYLSGTHSDFDMEISELVTMELGRSLSAAPEPSLV
jgi:putative nucleotidyltransferase with HDIG domain